MPTQTPPPASFFVVPSYQQKSVVDSLQSEAKSDSLPETQPQQKVPTSFQTTEKWRSSDKNIKILFDTITLNDGLRTLDRWDSVIEVGVKGKSGSGNYLEFTGSHSPGAAAIVGGGLCAAAILGVQSYRKVKSQEWNDNPHNLLSLLNTNDVPKLNEWIKDIFAHNQNRFQYLQGLEFEKDESGALQLKIQLTKKWQETKEKTRIERLAAIGGVLRNCVDVPGTLFWLVMINTAVISGTLGTLYNLGPIAATSILIPLLLIDLIYVGIKLKNYTVSQREKVAQAGKEQAQKPTFESLTSQKTEVEEQALLEEHVNSDANPLISKSGDQTGNFILTQAHQAEFLSLLRSLIFKQQYEKAAEAIKMGNADKEINDKKTDAKEKQTIRDEKAKSLLAQMTGVDRLNSENRALLLGTVAVLGAGLAAFNIQQFALFLVEWYSGALGGPGGSSTFGHIADTTLATIIIAIAIAYMFYTMFERNQQHKQQKEFVGEITGNDSKLLHSPVVSTADVKAGAEAKEKEAEARDTATAADPTTLWNRVETQYKKLLHLQSQEKDLLEKMPEAERQSKQMILNQTPVPDFFDPMAFEDARKVNEVETTARRNAKKGIKRLYMGILAAESAMMLLRFCVVPSTGGVLPFCDSLRFPSSYGHGLGLSFPDAFMIAAICTTVLWGLSKMAFYHASRNDSRATLFLQQLPERAYALDLQVAHYEKRVEYLQSQPKNQEVLVDAGGNEHEAVESEGEKQALLAS